MSAPSRVVLVTGAASGIGKATALHLHAAGWKVVASARSEAQLADLAAAGCATVALDVADAASREAAVARVTAEHGPVGVLVNNAGYSLSGATEGLSLDAIRRQFETNVFGVIGLSQLVLPAMRAQRWGKVLNVSSMGGTLTFPGGGAYHASKYALEAFSDAMRFELRGFGVDVIVIQPGLIKTHFADAVAANMAAPDPDHPYAAFDATVLKATLEVYQGPLAALGGVPEDVARVIGKAVAAKRPRARYPVTWSATLAMAQRRWSPDWAWDAFMHTTFPAPGTGA